MTARDNPLRATFYVVVFTRVGAGDFLSTFIILQRYGMDRRPHEGDNKSHARLLRYFPKCIAYVVRTARAMTTSTMPIQQTRRRGRIFAKVDTLFSLTGTVGVLEVLGRFQIGFEW